MTELVPSRCWHCSESIPPECDLAVEWGGKHHPVCCPGCKSVAELILESGMERYYRFREGEARKADNDIDVLSDAWDDLSGREEFIGVPTSEGVHELLLQIDGIRCGACAWLIRNHVGSLGCVRDVHVDTATGYTRIHWIPSLGSPGDLARAFLEIGYRPHLPLSTRAIRERRRQQRALLKRVGVAGLGMMQVMMYAVGLYVGPGQDIEPVTLRFLQWVSLIITTPVVLYSARPFFEGATRDLKARSLGMDVPVSLAIAGAYVASAFNFFRGSGEVYFDSVVMFTFFLLLARYVELALRHRNLDAGAALARLLPEWARRITDNGVQIIPATELACGDRVRVPAGEAFPADGHLLDRAAEVNEALMTGEAAPVVRHPGDVVIAGTINVAQPVDVEVTAAGEGSTLSGLARLLLRAQTERPRSVEITDRIAGWFVGGVLMIASATALYWRIHDPGQAFSATLAVLVASCPCALALAIPAVRTAASRALLRSGVLLSRGHALETLASIDTVVFDKTGTLTRGEPRVTATRINPDRAEWDESHALAAAAALEAHSRHPVARAFREYSRPEVMAESVSVHAGHGLEGLVNGSPLRLGHATYASPVAAPNEPDDWPVWLADGAGWIAAFRIGDTRRDGAASIVNDLREDGVDVRLVSGDHQPAVESLASDLGITSWSARQSPDRKLEQIRQLQTQGRCVLMVGDGVNDAPVLAGADVSMAVQGGADLANAAADLVALDESLVALQSARIVASKARRIVRQNLTWAIGYNLLAIPFAAAGILQPWMAALGMSASSLLVVLNAMRVGRAGN